MIPTIGHKHKIILASQSPRRRQLLKEAGFEFELRHQDVEESWPSEVLPEDVAPYLARKKAEAMRGGLRPGEILITADSTVLLGQTIYNKPQNFEDACSILRNLSGKMHHVITGVCMISIHKEEVFKEVTNVFFGALSEEEIQYYVTNFKPYDKAGAYAVQEWIGLCKITRIEGDFYNVIGFPIQAIYRRLQNWMLSPSEG
jgi:septum formation protein